MIEIDQACVSAFIAGSFGLPIAHENDDDEVKALAPDAAFVALQVLQNPSSPFDLDDTDDVTGFLQFDLRYPAGSGAIVAKQKRSEIFAAFPIGRVLNYGGQSVKVTGKHAVSNRVDGGHYLVIGRINWRAFVPR